MSRWNKDLEESEFERSSIYIELLIISFESRTLLRQGKSDEIRADDRQKYMNHIVRAAVSIDRLLKRVGLAVHQPEVVELYKNAVQIRGNAQTKLAFEIWLAAQETK